MTTPHRLGHRNTGRKGWGTELAPALAQPELADVSVDTEPARRAAYWLAVVLGNCRLRGFDLGKEDGTLSVPTALAASRRLASLLPQWTEDAQRLEERLDRVDGEVEANDLCFDLLEARMEVWATFVAIDEAYQAGLVERSEQRAEFATLIDRLLDQTEELDRQMQDQLALLSLVAPYPLLDNWRNLLGKPYDDVMPWWLDGCLETAFKRTQQSLLSDWPRPRQDRFQPKRVDEKDVLPFDQPKMSNPERWKTLERLEWFDKQPDQSDWSDDKVCILKSMNDDDLFDYLEWKGESNPLRDEIERIIEERPVDRLKAS